MNVHLWDYLQQFPEFMAIALTIDIFLYFFNEDVEQIPDETILSLIGFICGY